MLNFITTNMPRRTAPVQLEVSPTGGVASAGATGGVTELPPLPHLLQSIGREGKELLERLGAPPPPPSPNASTWLAPVALVAGMEQLDAPELPALMRFLCHAGERCAVEWLPKDADAQSQRRAFARANFAITTHAHAAKLVWMPASSVSVLIAPDAKLKGRCGYDEQPFANTHLWWCATRPRKSGRSDLRKGWSGFRQFSRWLFRNDAMHMALYTEAGQHVPATQRSGRLLPSAAAAAFADEASAVVTAVVQGNGSSHQTRRQGHEAVTMLQTKRTESPATGKAELAELKNLLCISQLVGLHRQALRYARELLEAPACGSSCYCSTAGIVVNLLRAGTDSAYDGDARVHRAAADAFFERHVGERCSYRTSWQMSSPPEQFEPGFNAMPWWDPADFAVGRLLTERSEELLRELQPYASRAPWRTDQGVPYELIEAGAWRQLSLYEDTTGWDDELCNELPVTCGYLHDLQSSVAGQRELGTKVKLFELGPGAALRPHFGVTNRRIFLHFAVNLPSSGTSFVRVGSGEEHAWVSPGQLMLFDDSFEHEVWNEAAEPRHVLGIELLHPDLAALEDEEEEQELEDAEDDDEDDQEDEEAEEADIEPENVEAEEEAEEEADEEAEEEAETEVEAEVQAEVQAEAESSSSSTEAALASARFEIGRLRAQLGRLRGHEGEADEENDVPEVDDGGVPVIRQLSDLTRYLPMGIAFNIGLLLRGKRHAFQVDEDEHVAYEGDMPSGLTAHEAYADLTIEIARLLAPSKRLGSFDSGYGAVFYDRGTPAEKLAASAKRACGGGRSNDDTCVAALHGLLGLRCRPEAFREHVKSFRVAAYLHPGASVFMAQQCTSGDEVAALQDDLLAYAPVAQEMEIGKLQLNVITDVPTFSSPS